MRYRIAEPLEEVANRIARRGGMPADKKRSYRQDQNDSLKQAIHKCYHSALRSAVFKISGALLVVTPRGGVRTAQHAIPASRITRAVAVDLVFARPHDFRLALITRFKHFQRQRVS
jgi:hypothetical protein